MKIVTFLSTLILICASLFSCADENITMLYHPAKKPVFYWLLERVYYPDKQLEELNRKDFSLSYNNNDSLQAINIFNSEFISIDYLGDRISYSKFRKNESTVVYDSILVKLNDKKQAEYIRHVSYTERKYREDVSKCKSIDDSLALYYNADGYLIQLESYGSTGDPLSLRQTEKYTIENGNIVEILSIAGYSTVYRHTYIYDDTEHASSAEYCYEMPYNTTAFAANGCWLMNNLPYLSKYLGKKSKNNIIQAIITLHDEKEITQFSIKDESYVYGDIKYEYTYDENKILSKVKISGMINNISVPENYITTFSYLQKEKE